MVFEMNPLHQITKAILLDDTAVKGQHGRHDLANSFNLLAVEPEILLGDIVAIDVGRQQRPRRAAVHIAQGELDTPIEVVGENEVGRLGNAFETMRVSLQTRLKELSLLLRVRFVLGMTVLSVSIS